VLAIKSNMVIYWIYFLFQCVNWHYLKSAFVWRYGTLIWPLTSHHVLYESAPFAVCPDPRSTGPLMGPINGWHKNWISELIMQKNTLIDNAKIDNPPISINGSYQYFWCRKMVVASKVFLHPNVRWKNTWNTGRANLEALIPGWFSFGWPSCPPWPTDRWSHDSPAKLA
jgi:hypothetical protein